MHLGVIFLLLIALFIIISLIIVLTQPVFEITAVNKLDSTVIHNYDINVNGNVCLRIQTPTTNSKICEKINNWKLQLLMAMYIMIIIFTFIFIVLFFTTSLPLVLYIINGLILFIASITAIAILINSKKELADKQIEIQRLNPDFNVSSIDYTKTSILAYVVLFVIIFIILFGNPVVWKIFRIFRTLQILRIFDIFSHLDLKL